MKNFICIFMGNKKSTDFVFIITLDWLFTHISENAKEKYYTKKLNSNWELCRTYTLYQNCKKGNIYIIKTINEGDHTKNIFIAILLGHKLLNFGKKHY